MRRLDLRREDGVAMTEFALILPIFMVIVAGMLGFGRVFFYWIQANHVANETARWAVVDRNPYAPDHATEGRRTARATEFNSDSTVCIHFPARRPRRARRSTSGDVAKPFTFVPILNIGKITIRASSTMRIERLGTQRRPTPRRSLQRGVPDMSRALETSGGR